MGDVGEDWRAMEKAIKERKNTFGVNCPSCTVKLPRATPKVLLPGQKCWCGYRDLRKKLGE
jgi:hypothetical protein